ncbi:MAG: hypothetical protein Q9225_002708 [Loekoesia sp. 1 TL-2023]
MPEVVGAPLSDHDLIELQLTQPSPVLEETADDETPREQSPTPRPISTTTSPVQDVVNIVNGILSMGKHQSKRKAESIADHGTRSPKPGKRQKLNDHNNSDKVASSTAGSQVQEGKLKRPTPKLNGQVDNTRVKGRDPFDMDDDTEEDTRSSQAKAAKTTRTQKSSASEAAGSVPITKKSPEMAAVSPKKGKKPRGRPKGTQRQPEVVNEDSRYNLRDRKFDAVASSPPQRPKHKSPPPKTGSAAAGTDPKDVEAEEDDRSYVEEDETDDGPSLRNQGSSVNEAISVERAGSVPSQRSAASQKNNTEKPKSTKDRPEPDHNETAIEEHGNASSQEASPEPNRRSGSPRQTAQSPETVSDEPDLVFFGQETAWREILTAKRKIGVSNIRGQQKMEVPRLETEEIKSLINCIEQATWLYKFITSKTRSGSTVQQETVNELQEAIHGIQEVINDHPSDSPSENNDASKFVQDVYAHGIPSMVDLLKEALETRSPQLSDKKNVAALKEIIPIQDALFTLCEKARGSKAKPPTARPIIQPTVTIKPLIESMRVAFVAELKERNRLIKAEEDHVKRLKEIEEEKRAEREWTVVRKREKEMSDRRAWEEICRKVKDVPGFEQFLSQPRQGIEYRRSKAPVIKDQWSREQDEELLVELWAEELGELPAEERYLKVLNAPLLKNKLPVHIKERALGYKEAMEKVLRDQGSRVPDWLLDME